MCNALNGIAIVLCFRGISVVTGYRQAVWQVIITLAIIISTGIALIISPPEARRDRRRFLLLARVVMTILLNFIHLSGGEYRY